MNYRVRYIDGLRGIAIIFVVLFHGYSRWSSTEPFEQADFLIKTFSYGWLGVNLFFAISGYVIYMSILRSDNLIMFSVARYLRLLPAMLIASIIIYFSSHLIPERPHGSSNLIDFLPSLTFIGPGLLSKITGLEIRSLDGAFWSLYVEVKFYFVVAATFFIFKDKNLNLLLILFMAWLCLSAVQYLINAENIFISLLLKIMNFLGIKYYGWFLIGVCAFKFNSHRTLFNLLILLLITFLAIFTTEFGNKQTTFAASLAAILFLMPLFLAWIRSILSSKLLLFFGFISYPLYLVHQNIVIGLAIKLHNAFPSVPAFLYPLPFIILVIFIAFIIAKLEPLLKIRLRSFLSDKIFGYEVYKRN